MSGLKYINIKEQTPALLNDACGYLISSSKTNNGTLIGGHALFPQDAARCMRALKNCYHKLGGRQFVTFTLTPTSSQSDIPTSKYLELASELAGYFDGYQSLYTVHTDTSHTHVHVLINSVNYLTGKKFSQSRMDLNHFRAECNNMLSARGFDIIRDSANDFWAEVDYPPNLDFSCLEYDLPSEPGELSSPDYHTPERSIPMAFNDYDQNPFPKWNPSPKRHRRNNSYSNVPQMPTAQIVMPSEIPTTTIKCGPTFNLNGCTAETVEALQQLAEAQAARAAAQQQQAAQLALTLQQQFQNANTPMNVYVDASPTFNVGFGQVQSLPTMQPSAYELPSYSYPQPQSLPQPEYQQPSPFIDTTLDYNPWGKK